MAIQEFLKLVRGRRSIRRFKPDPVPDEYLDQILEAARWAMSGANGQPWEFIVIKDKNMRDKIAELRYETHVKQSWEIEKTRIPELRHPSLTEGPRRAPLENAPVLIVVVGDPRTYQATVLSTHFLCGEGGPMATYLKGVGNATQNLQLAAAALGLGAQWASVNRALEEPLKRLLGVPDVLQIHTIVPIGYPVSKQAPPYRRKREEFVHYERYDQSKYRSGADIFEFLRSLRQRTKGAYPGQPQDATQDESSMMKPV